MTRKRKQTREEADVSRNFQETNIAAKNVIRSINQLRKTLSGTFVTPDIDRELKAAIKTMQSIRDDSTEQKAAAYLQNLKEA